MNFIYEVFDPNKQAINFFAYPVSFVFIFTTF